MDAPQHPNPVRVQGPEAEALRDRAAAQLALQETLQRIGTQFPRLLIRVKVAEMQDACPMEQMIRAAQVTD